MENYARLNEILEKVNTNEIAQISTKGEILKILKENYDHFIKTKPYVWGSAEFIIYKESLGIRQGQIERILRNDYGLRPIVEIKIIEDNSDGRFEIMLKNDEYVSVHANKNDLKFMKKITKNK